MFEMFEDVVYMMADFASALGESVVFLCSLIWEVCCDVCVVFKDMFSGKKYEGPKSDDFDNQWFDSGFGSYKSYKKNSKVYYKKCEPEAAKKKTDKAFGDVNMVISDIEKKIDKVAGSFSSSTSFTSASVSFQSVTSKSSGDKQENEKPEQKEEPKKKETHVFGDDVRVLDVE